MWLDDSNIKRKKKHQKLQVETGNCVVMFRRNGSRSDQTNLEAFGHNKIFIRVRLVRLSDIRDTTVTANIVVVGSCCGIVALHEGDGILSEIFNKH